MFNKHDITRDACMLRGPLRKQGYDWWWHSFTAKSDETGEEKPFFIEFYVCNPDLAEEEPVLGQLPENRAAGKKPSYLMVKAGCWGEEHCQLHRFFAWKDVEIHNTLIVHLPSTGSRTGMTLTILSLICLAAAGTFGIFGRKKETIE